jgi:hypothetical protein
LTPVAYSLFDGLGQRVGRLFGKREPAPALVDASP